MSHSNRDMRRNNPTHNILKGYLCSELSNSTFELLDKKQEGSSFTVHDKKMLDIVRQSTLKMVDCFTKTKQTGYTSISKKNATRVASQQHHLIKRAIKYGDDIDKVQGIDNDLCSNDIIEMYKEITDHESHTDINKNIENSFIPTENTTINQEVQANVDNSSIDPENTTVNQSDECIDFVKKFVETKLGLGQQTPFSIIKFFT